jgi:putative ABC transport system substrate-binding protein
LKGQKFVDRRVFVRDVVYTFLAAPLVAAAQPANRVKRVGFLAPVRSDVRSSLNEAFALGLRELGHVDGQNVIVEWRYGDGTQQRLTALAAELVRIPVDVIVVAGPIPLRAAREATATIPIVMAASSADPVGDGVAASLARPGGNITGLTYAVTTERFGKQLEMLKEIAPAASRIAVWWDLDLAQFRQSWATPLDVAARNLGLQVLEPFQVLDEATIDPAFASMNQQRADAVLVAIGGPTHRYRARVAATALAHRLPTMSAFKQFTEDGGLVSYGPSFPDIYRRAASYVDRILKGAKPGELPIELPSKYELVINLATARALGLTVPQSLLVRADEVIQ